MKEQKLQAILSRLPDAPGIYLFYTNKKELVYVGKATSLQSRVSSYFRGERTRRPIEQMMHAVAAIDWRQTDSVLEAIILEANLIKKYQPKYNVIGKDDKSWNYIGITKDSYPQVITIRAHDLKRMDQQKKQETNSKIQKNSKFQILNSRFQHLFGPYPGLNTKATMKLLRKLFLYSTCRPQAKRPCLYYQLGQCLGVCTGEISATDYRAKVIRPLVTFLRGRKKQLIKDLERQMKVAAKAEDFEEASRLRNQIFSLQRIQDIALLNKTFIEDEKFQIPNSKFYIQRVEGYDISNLGSTGMVGSMVVFTRGEPDKNQYRKFKIRTVAGQSDVDCLEEVIRRRLRHTEWEYPQLFLIDGGRPQVNRVTQILDELGVAIPVVGIAKGPERKRNDIIFGLQQSDFRLQRELVRWVYAHTRLLIAVRDEAHRFAISYQRQLRRV